MSEAEILRTPEESFKKILNDFSDVIARDITVAKGFDQEINKRKLFIIDAGMIKLAVNIIFSKHKVEGMIVGFFKRSFPYWDNIDEAYKSLVNRSENPPINFIKEHFARIFPPELPREYLPPIELLWEKYLDIPKKQSWIKYIHTLIKISIRYIFTGRKPISNNRNDKMKGIIYKNPSFMTEPLYKSFKDCPNNKKVDDILIICPGCEECGNVIKFDIDKELERFKCNGFGRYFVEDPKTPGNFYIAISSGN